MLTYVSLVMWKFHFVTAALIFHHLALISLHCCTIHIAVVWREGKSGVERADCFLWKEGSDLVSRGGRGKGLGTAWRIGVDWKLGMAGFITIRMTC